jgi:hypothetical protein
MGRVSRAKLPTPIMPAVSETISMLIWVLASRRARMGSTPQRAPSRPAWIATRRAPRAETVFLALLRRRADSQPRRPIRA